MARYLNRRALLSIVLVLLLAIFLPPFINVNRFRPQIAGALGRALGRPVSVDAISLRLFPRPGLNLQRLVVQDDPAFSAEPLLRADDVTASLRLMSLWRGRLEIARLSLSYPSLNLVRAPNGHWNLESLLERARQTPIAPTTKLHAEARLRFPYVEAEGGRINLKIGQEKKVYALSDADFALWLEQENEWHLRLAARPVRTDANLSDTGTIRLAGKVQRGAALSDTPLDLQLLLQGAQLGQLTTLIYGRDRGWRGTVNITAALAGTPAALRVVGDGSIDDFRRYDIATRGALRLATRCTGVFSTSTQDVSDIACHSAVGNGALELRGRISGVLPPRAYELTATAIDLPASSLLGLAQRMKRDLPQDLSGSGTVVGIFDLGETTSVGPTWTGSGTASRLELRSALMKEPLTLDRVDFVLGLPQQNGRSARANAHRPAVPPLPALHINSLPLDLGASAPAKAQAWFSRAGYNIGIQGDAQLPRLLEIAHLVGLAAPWTITTGLASVDLSVAGTWSGFAAPLVTGTVSLHAATAQLPGFAFPLRIASATLTASPAAIAVDSLNAGFSGTDLGFTGWLHLPRTCSIAGACPVQLQLSTDHFSTDELNALLNPASRRRPWYDLIGSSRPEPPLLKQVQAQGTFTAGRVMVKALAATRVSGSLQLGNGSVDITNLHADILGGRHVGELHADFTGAEPVYRLRGTVDQVSVAAIAAMTHDDWGSGRANAAYQIVMSGWKSGDLWRSAGGSMNFDWREGALTHLALNGAAGPLRIRRFHGNATLQGAQLTFAASKMETPGGIYEVSGNASLDRQLELKLMRGRAQGFDVGGTLERPRVNAIRLPHTEAALKP